MLSGLVVLVAVLALLGAETCELQQVPVALQPPIGFAPFAVRLTLPELQDVRLVKASASSVVISADFGTMEVEGQSFSLQRFELLRGAHTRIADKEFVAEARVGGVSPAGRTVELLALFDLGRENRYLADAHFGAGGVKTLGVGDELEVRVLSLEGLFSPNGQRHFIRFTAASRGTCTPTDYFLHFTTFELSAAQLDELAAPAPVKAHGMSNGMSLVQNRGTAAVTAIPRPHTRVYPVLDAGLEVPRFRSTAVSTSLADVRAALTTNDTTSLLGFEMYVPPVGEGWGHIPPKAIMPWEIAYVESQGLNIEVVPFTPVVAPIANYTYTPLFYYRTARNATREGKLLYVPHLVITPVGGPDLAEPTGQLRVFAPEYQTVVTIPLIRDTEESPARRIPDADADSSLQRLVALETAVSVEPVADQSEVDVVEVKRERLVRSFGDSAGEKTSGGYSVLPEALTPRQLNQTVAVALNRLGAVKVFNEVVLRLPQLQTPFNVFPLECREAYRPLPARAGVLNIPNASRETSESVERTKHLVLVFCPTKKWSRSFTSVYAPVWVLVHAQFDFRSRKHVPFVVKTLTTFTVDVRDIEFTTSAFEEVVEPRALVGTTADTLPFVEGIVSEESFRRAENVAVVNRTHTSSSEQLAVEKQLFEMRQRIEHGGSAVV